MRDICSECGDRKILNDRGVCANRFGCEHRQFQHKARTERLLAAMDRSAAFHEAAARDHAKRIHPAFRPLSEGPEQTNKWLDEWLHRPKDWGE